MILWRLARAGFLSVLCWFVTRVATLCSRSGRIVTGQLSLRHYLRGTLGLVAALSLAVFAHSGFTQPACIEYENYLHWITTFPVGHQPCAIAISGTYAYVADLEFGLRVVEIADPRAPRIVTSLKLPGFIGDVAVSGNHAYVVSGAFGLQVIDVSNPEQPLIVGSVDTPDYSADVAVAGDYAYVADRESGLQVIDVANPLSPHIVGTVDIPGGSRGVAAAGNYAYVVGGPLGFRVIDVADPEHPEVIGFEYTRGLRLSTLRVNLLTS